MHTTGKYGEGKYTLLDDEDAKYFEDSGINLRISSEGYVVYGDSCKGVHRTIMNASNGMLVDHINHNKLDNRKTNLRICTNQQNQMNRKSNKVGTSKYKGVSFDKTFGKWRAAIMFNKKYIHIGRFMCEHEAAKAYNERAKKLFGEFAYLNDIK